MATVTFDVYRSVNYGMKLESPVDEYHQLLEGKGDFSLEERADRIKELLSQIPEEEKKLLFFNPDILSHIDEAFLVDLAMSFKEPVDSEFFAASLKTSVGKYALFCWNNRLSDSLYGLMENDSQTAGQALLEEIRKGQIGEKIGLILLVQNSFSPEMISEIYSILLKESETSSPVAQSLRFFCSKGSFQSYIMGDNASEEHLKAAFKTYYETGSFLLCDLTARIHLQDQKFISQFAAKKMEENFDDFLTSRIGTILPLLDVETSRVLDEKLGEMLLNGDHEEVKDFVASNKKSSLQAFKFQFPASLRGFTSISPGTQVGKDGFVDLEEAERVTAQLNSHRPPSVYFDAVKLEDNLSGGTCSAMALRFLKKYRIARETASTPLEALQKIAPNFAISSPEYRTLQSAYNTIGKITTSGDFKLDKINALLKYDNPDLQAFPICDEVDLGSPESQFAILKVMKKEVEGIFFIRCLNPLPENGPVDGDLKFKEEQYGHSTLLIKEAGRAYYYDPVIGVVEVHSAVGLGTILLWEDHRCNIPKARFYKLA